MEPRQGDDFCVAAVQMVSSTRVQDNLRKAAAGIAQAARSGAQLVVLPEYFCLMGQEDSDKLKIMEPIREDILENLPDRKASPVTHPDTPLQDFLRQQAMQHGIWLVGGTIPLASAQPRRIYNATLVFNPQGELLSRYDKIHLFGFQKDGENYDESRTILPGTQPRFFEAPCGRVGLSICYDLRFPELYRRLAPASLMVVPAAFTYTTGASHWEILLRTRAIENQCYVLASAQGGQHENGRQTWGHSMLIDPWGEIIDCLAQGPGVVSGWIKPQRLQDIRTRLPALAHRVL